MLGQDFTFPRCPLLVRRQQNLFAIAALGQFLDDVPGEIPVRIFPRLRDSLPQMLFPVSLQLWNMILLQQRLPLLIVLAMTPQIRTEFAAFGASISTSSTLSKNAKKL